MKRFAFIAAAALSLAGVGHANSCSNCDCFAYPEYALFDGCETPQGHFFAYGDYLFWNNRRCNLDFVLVESIEDPVAEFRSIDPGYSSGYRVGLGYRACDGYEISGRYTHYRSSDSKDQIFEPPLFAIGTRVSPLNPFFGLATPFAAYDYRLNYDVVDIELAAWKNIGCDTQIKGFVGSKLAWLDERLDTAYILSTDPEIFGPGTYVNESNDFKGFGLSLGFEVEKEIYCKLGFFGRGALSVLVSDAEVIHRDFLFTSPEVDPTLLVDVHDRHHCLTSVAELAVGLDYELFRNCDWFVKLAVGYEFNGWYNMPDFITLTSSLAAGHQSRNLGRMGFDGLFVRLLAAY